VKGGQSDLRFKNGYSNRLVIGLVQTNELTAPSRRSIKTAVYILAIVGLGTGLFAMTRSDRPSTSIVESGVTAVNATTNYDMPPIQVPPVADLKPRDLRDSFNEIHHGHRHAAIDILKPRGTPVHAVVDGIIRKIFFSKGGGNTIYEFDGRETYCYYYAHLDRYAEGLREGQRIYRGDVLGYVGSTGNASPDAPHLHFAVYALGQDKRWSKGTPLDPYPMLMRFLRNAG
jgi:peptidoglycan LD-endopeptidase LytH